MLDDNAKQNIGTMINITSDYMCQYYDIAESSIGIITGYQHDLPIPSSVLYDNKKKINTKTHKKISKGKHAFPNPLRYMYIVFVEQKEIYLYSNELKKA